MTTKRIKSLVTAGLLVFSIRASAQSVERPNILLILVDDLGYGDLSCQGGRDIRTPNIDRIIDRGIRFTDFHANCPVSSPSRAAMLTGRFPDMVGVHGVVYPDGPLGYLSPDAVLLPTVLKSAGYHSALVGKWHLGHESPNLPNDRGFDHFKGFLGGMMDYYTHLHDGNNLDYMRHNHEPIETQGIHATDLFTDWAVEYLHEQKGKKEPFFLYLAYTAPHTPIQPPQEWEEKVKRREPGITEQRAQIVALIEHLDDGVGRVLATLEKNGMMDNTFIIFTSDNGGALGTGANNGIYRGSKGQMFEGGIRVACGMYWKGKIEAGRVTDNLALLSDLFPTICNAAGAQFSHPVDGINLMPTLLGEDQITNNRTVYWMRRRDAGGMIYYAARQGNFKILQNAPGEPFRFFDLDADPVERKPLDPDKDSPEIFRQLLQSQLEHIRLSGAVPWKKEE